MASGGAVALCARTKKKQQKLCYETAVAAPTATTVKCPNIKFERIANVVFSNFMIHTEFNRAESNRGMMNNNNKSRTKSSNEREQKIGEQKIQIPCKQINVRVLALRMPIYILLAKNFSFIF